MANQEDESGFDFENHTGEPYDSIWNYLVEEVSAVTVDDETHSEPEIPDDTPDEIEILHQQLLMTQGQLIRVTASYDLDLHNPVWNFSMTDETFYPHIDYERNLNIIGFFKYWERCSSSERIQEKVQRVARYLASSVRETYITRQDIENGKSLSEQGIPWKEMGTTPAIAKEFRRHSYNNYVNTPSSDVGRVSERLLSQ